MVITKHQLYQLMWVNQCHVYHPPVITMFIGGINYYYSQMGGWWHCFTHISWDSWCLVMTIIITIINHHQLLYYHWFCPHYYSFPGWNLGLPHGQSPFLQSFGPRTHPGVWTGGSLLLGASGAAGRERTRGWAMLFGQQFRWQKMPWIIKNLVLWAAEGVFGRYQIFWVWIYRKYYLEIQGSHCGVWLPGDLDSPPRIHKTQILEALNLSPKI